MNTVLSAWAAAWQRGFTACALGLILLLATTAAHAQTYDLTVAKDGTGNYTTVQAAINAAPTGRTTPFTIFIRNGKYKEKINVASNKNFVHLIGESVANTILTFDDYSGKPNPAGGTFGTSNSASVSISAPDFAAFNLTFENSTGDSPQALAINVTADRAVFKNCRFLGGQDTVLANGNGLRQYFRDCYIDGTVDFIFGGSIAVFERCIIYPKTRRDGNTGGYITAANTVAGQTYGYVFRNCIIPANQGTTTYTLGRPWQNDGGSTTANRANNKVVWLKTTMGSNIVSPQGWSAWDGGTNTSVITYAEYQSRNFQGGLVNVSQRVNWSRQLTSADTAQYMTSSVFGSWNPCAVTPGVCATFSRPIAVTNFRGVKGTTTTAFTWNASWGIAQVQYELLRATTRRGTYTNISTITAANDTTYNFQRTDALPAAGAAYYYYVRATKAGMATHISDTVEISRVPTITTNGTLGAFTQYLNGPSAPRTYSVSGVNLTNDITITAPANFEISNNGGTTWNTSATPLVLTTTNNAVLTTTISVRLNAATAGTYSGTISHSSAGAGSPSLAVTGTKLNSLEPVSNPLLWWPMSRNNQDSTLVRAAQVMASTPTLRKFVVSSGSAAAGRAPYSLAVGQAIAPLADGAWTTALGGNGGNLNRTYYEQFTVTAAASATQPVRVDSLVLTSYVTGSTSNTKLAVVWSRSGFVSDSADVNGGKGPIGIFNSTANGGFTTPVFLTTQATYRFSFAGATGVSLAPGQTLTFRTYFSCGSTSTSTRFATLKNVIVKGQATTMTAARLSATAKNQLLVYPNPANEQLTAQHPRASQGATITVFSFDGRKVATINSQPGTTETTLPVAKLVPGNYLLLYSADGVRMSSTITKQ